MWEASQHLSTCRPIGLKGVGPIPWTAISEYAHRRNITGVDYDRFEHFIGVLDTKYLAHQTAKGKNK